MHSSNDGSLLRQPKAVWAVAFACVVAFMGIGLVDPILPAIAVGLHAGPSQVELLFTSYFAITGAAMLVTGVAASRLGPRRTLLVGLALVVVFSALSGTSGSVGELVGFRAGWGLGNALFIATALAVIVGAASGGVGGAIILYESALGLGISVGPLLGGALGAVSWRAPFFGTAALMAIGFVLIAALLGDVPRPERTVRFADPLRAVAHPALLTVALVALFYNYGFFTLLAYTPFVLHMGAHGIGLVFFGWGLLLAVFSVLVAPRLERRFGTLRTLYVVFALLAGALFAMTVLPRDGLVVVTILAGALLGINNTLVTQAVMTVSDAPRPVASAGYNFVRWIGGAVAPYLAGQLAEHVDARAPFVVAGAAIVIGLLVLLARRGHLRTLPTPTYVDLESEPVPDLANAR